MNTKYELKNKLHEHFNTALRHYPPPPVSEVPIKTTSLGPEHVQNLLTPAIREGGFIISGKLGKINNIQINGNTLFFQIHGVMLPAYNAAIFRTLWIISQGADIAQRGEYYNYFTYNNGVFRRANAADAFAIRDALLAIQDIEPLSQEASADLNETLNAIGTIGELLLTLET